MYLNKLKIKKYSIRALLFIIIVYLSNFLDKFFDNFNSGLLEKFKIKIPAFINFFISIFSFKIPIYSLLISMIIIWLLYNIYKNIKLKKNVLIILKANYGKNGRFVDITKELNDKVENNKLKIVLSNSIVGDPMPHVVKEGNIKYKYNKKIFEEKYNEYDVIELPKSEIDGR